MLCILHAMRGHSAWQLCRLMKPIGTHTLPVDEPSTYQKNRNDYDFRWCRFVDPSGDLAHWVTLLTEYLYLGLGYFVLQIIDGRLEEVTVLV
jgi:hypothetical protein